MSLPEPVFLHQSAATKTRSTLPALVVFWVPHWTIDVDVISSLLMIMTMLCSEIFVPALLDCCVRSWGVRYSQNVSDSKWCPCQFLFRLHLSSQARLPLTHLTLKHHLTDLRQLHVRCEATGWPCLLGLQKEPWRHQCISPATWVSHNPGSLDKQVD